MAGHKPKYMILVEWVKGQIEAGSLVPGQKLNSENELSAMFGISRQTVRHAIGILVSEGIIEKKRGSGTYISNFFKKEREDSTMNIAVVTTYVDDYIFPVIIRGIEKVVSGAGYTMQIAFTHNSVDKERLVLQNILDKNMIDGMLIETTKSALPNPNKDLYEEIIRRGIPTLFIHSSYPGVDIPHVSVDDKAAGKLVTNYLIDQGHEKIAGMFKSDDGQGHVRYAGYVEALMERGLKVPDEHILWFDTEDSSDLYAVRRKIIRRLKNCTACVCYNDDLANRLLPILAKEGIRVPEDLSLVSIDNSELAELCEVPLTSAVHPMSELGVKAAEYLLAMIQGEQQEADYEFKPELKIRKSVKCLK